MDICDTWDTHTLENLPEPLGLVKQYFAIVQGGPLDFYQTTPSSYIILHFLVDQYSGKISSDVIECVYLYQHYCRAFYKIFSDQLTFFRIMSSLCVYIAFNFLLKINPSFIVIRFTVEHRALESLVAMLAIGPCPVLR